MTPHKLLLSLWLIKSQFAVAASSLGKWWGSHRLVWTHQELPQGHYTNGFWRCFNCYLSNEESHVFHRDNEETRGMFWLLYWIYYMCCTCDQQFCCLNKAQCYRVLVFFFSQQILYIGCPQFKSILSNEFLF